LMVFILSAVSLFAQERQENVPDRGFLSVSPDTGGLWICPGAETALYSTVSLSYGAGLALAYGKKASIGLKAAFFFDAGNELDVLELNVLLRYYLFSGAAGSGPFFQFSGGPALYFERNDAISLPGRLGMISAGLSFGWRFLLGNRFFMEPSIRGGYPYIAGAGLSAGVQF